MLKIGVLALQGAFKEHISILEELGCEAVEVRKAEQLADLDGIILPGGESTAIGRLLNDFNIREALVNRIKSGLPAWGTCAGMILLANKLDGDEAAHLKVMDITVRRNAYGTQLNSFITTGIIDEVSPNEIPMIFIRAPFIVDRGEKVKVLCRIGGHIVAARQDNILATSFHPELTENKSFHKYFVSICKVPSN